MVGEKSRYRSLTPSSGILSANASLRQRFWLSGAASGVSFPFFSPSERFRTRPPLRIRSEQTLRVDRAIISHPCRSISVSCAINAGRHTSSAHRPAFNSGGQTRECIGSTAPPRVRKSETSEKNQCDRTVSWTMCLEDGALAFCFVGCGLACRTRPSVSVLLSA